MSSGHDIWRRDEPESPCRRVCVLHPEAGLCIGCLRTSWEIAAWPELSREERRRIMAELPARADVLKQRRGGRARTRGADSQKAGSPGRTGRE